MVVYELGAKLLAEEMSRADEETQSVGVNREFEGSQLVLIEDSSFLSRSGTDLSTEVDGERSEGKENIAGSFARPKKNTFKVFSYTHPW